MIRDRMDGGRDSIILTINIYMCLPNYKNMLGFWYREYVGKLRFWSLNGRVMLVVCDFISEIANHFAYAKTPYQNLFLFFVTVRGQVEIQMVQTYYLIV